MMEDNFQKVVKNICRIILKNKTKMIREEDIKNMCENYDFNDVISEVYNRLNDVGFELIATNFLEQKYYVLTSEGKDDEITPSQYGTLATILAMSKEIDENLKLDDIKEIFSELWDSDVKFLIEKDYLRKININGLDIIKVTPLGKALLKNIIKDLNIKNILDILM